jgi:UDP-N-acetylmuramoyl-tripeptide--D-alanyl-D-alanine ligase
MSAALWTPEAMQAATGGRWTGSPAPATGVSIDTRTLKPGDLFVALRVARDGHDFVAAAFGAGAAAALVAEDRAGSLGGQGPLLLVKETLDGMTALGLAARDRTSARTIGVTGSVGKTGTKEALKTVLSGQGATHASVASYNNHWGVPLTLARMPAETRFGVFEMGMNHAGEIAPLSAMVRPHAGLITTVAPVHLENLGSIEAIADEKSAIFSGLREGGTAIVNRDNAHYQRMRRHAEASPAGRVVSFGEAPGSDVRLVAVSLDAEGSDVVAEVFGRRIRYRLGSPGRHIALNSLGVLAGVEALGGDVEAAAAALAGVRPPSGRGEAIRLAVPGGSIGLYDESYNANPASMLAALDILGRTPPGPGGRRIAVLGDMLELGEEGPAMHTDLAPAIEANGVDLVFTAGPLMEYLWRSLPAARRGAHSPQAAGLEDAVIAALRPGDVVTVKGSNGSRTHAIVAALKDRLGPAPDPAD